MSIKSYFQIGRLKNFTLSSRVEREREREREGGGGRGEGREKENNIKKIVKT